MTIYGYAKVSSEGGFNGKESDVQLFEDRNTRDHMMYEDYADTFDSMAENCDFEEDEDGEYVDANDQLKMTEEEFAADMRKSKDTEHDVFGLIQASDMHIQFEPFSRTF